MLQFHQLISVSKMPSLTGHRCHQQCSASQNFADALGSVCLQQSRATLAWSVTRDNGDKSKCECYADCTS